MEAKVVQSQSSSASTTLDFTSAGFGTPDAAVILSGILLTSEGQRVGISGLNMGITDFSSEFFSFFSSLHSGTVSDAFRRQANTRCAYVGGGVFANCSTITDGMRLTFSGAPPDNLLITALMLKDIDSDVDNLLGNGTVSGLTFAPSGVLYTTTGLPLSSEIGDVNAGIAIGVDDGGSQGGLFGGAINNLSSTDSRTSLWDTAVTAQSVVATTDWRSSSTIASDGYSLSVIQGTPGTDAIGTLAVGNCRVEVSARSVPSVTGDEVVSLSSTPKAAIALGTPATALGSEYSGLSAMVGVSDGTTSKVYSHQSPDNASTSPSSTSALRSQLVDIDGADGSNLADATVAFGGNSLTLTWSLVASGRKYLLITIADDAQVYDEALSEALGFVDSSVGGFVLSADIPEAFAISDAILPGAVLEADVSEPWILADFLPVEYDESVVDGIIVTDTADGSTGWIKIAKEATSWGKTAKVSTIWTKEC